jgi:ABC-type amino acid transport substrate-binding protein
MKILKNILIVLIISITLISCASKSTNSQSEDVLKVGISTGYPPLAFEKDGKIVGIEADYAELLGKYLNKKVKIIKIEWKDSVAALNSGKVDVIMSGASITDERKEKVLFSKPYMHIGQMAIIREGDLGRYGRPVDVFVKDLNVGYVKGTTGEKYAKRFLETATLFSFDTQKDAIYALKKKAIDYFIYDAPSVWQITNDPKQRVGLAGLYRPLTEEALAWAVKKDNIKLKEELDKALDEMKKSGELDKIQNKWIKVRVKIKSN